MRCPEPCRSRRGSFALEAVIATALLATAMVALAKYARTSSMLQQQADGRCAARLACENVLARLEGVQSDAVAEQAQRAADAVESSIGCPVAVVVAPFQSDAAEGLHLAITANPHVGEAITLHDWVVRPLVSDSPSQTDQDQTDQDQLDEVEASADPGDTTDAN